MPYGEGIPSEEGHTWRKYHKLCKNIDDKFKSDPTKTFKSNVFFTEMNPVPSKYSKGLSKKTKLERIDFFSKNEFFQKFKVVILAFGWYLNENQISQIFHIDNGDYSLSKKRSRLVSYFNITDNKLIIHTRQLSTDTSNELILNIAKKINEMNL